MRRVVSYVFTNISEESAASSFSVEKISYNSTPKWMQQVLLECDTVCFCRSLSTFRRNLFLPSSGLKINLLFYPKMEIAWSFETSVTSYQTTRCHIRERNFLSHNSTFSIPRTAYVVQNYWSGLFKDMRENNTSYTFRDFVKFQQEYRNVSYLRMLFVVSDHLQLSKKISLLFTSRCFSASQPSSLSLKS
jgi:hypothetical protein